MYLIIFYKTSHGKNMRKCKNDNNELDSTPLLLIIIYELAGRSLCRIGIDGRVGGWEGDIFFSIEVIMLVMVISVVIIINP